MSPTVLAFFADFVRSLPPWVFWAGGLACGVAAIASCYFGIDSLYRSRLIADMPTSKLRSAAQGYIELEGYAKMMEGEPIYAPLSGKPCVWYRYSVEQYRDSSEGGKEWATVESGVSEAIFLLVDPTGTCVVDPDGAEVTPSVNLTWRGNVRRSHPPEKKTSVWGVAFSQDAYRYSESRLHEYDALYAIGQFSGVGDREPTGINEATRDLLALWKRDRGGLLQRFDSNRDGKIDLDEWEQARQAAEQEVIATWRERQRQPEMNLLKQPADGRPYILSSASQQQIIALSRRKAVLGILGFLALGLVLVWSFKQRFA
jgi:hypothetical protein